VKAEVHIALLRGINVGGKNCLPMSGLKALFEAAGCRDVATYIQSGNVVFKAAAPLAKRIQSVISKRIEGKYGLKIPVVLRTAAELKQAATNNPFLKSATNLKALYVLFLADEPTPASIAGLDPHRSPPDAFAVHGREIYLYCPNGVARTKLTNDYFDRKLSTTSTARNWQTILKLVEMAGKIDG
jgi:uncharacterized protein (DUF1697 family)